MGKGRGCDTGGARLLSQPGSRLVHQAKGRLARIFNASPDCVDEWVRDGVIPIPQLPSQKQLPKNKQEMLQANVHRLFDLLVRDSLNQIRTELASNCRRDYDGNTHFLWADSTKAVDRSNGGEHGKDRRGTWLYQVYNEPPYRGEQPITAFARVLALDYDVDVETATKWLKEMGYIPAEYAERYGNRIGKGKRNIPTYDAGDVPPSAEQQLVELMGVDIAKVRFWGEKLFKIPLADKIAACGGLLDEERRRKDRIIDRLFTQLRQERKNAGLPVRQPLKTPGLRSVPRTRPEYILPDL
jgi:hypothetical protein